jgi:hypothetical protein
MVMPRKWFRGPRSCGGGPAAAGPQEGGGRPRERRNMLPGATTREVMSSGCVGVGGERNQALVPSWRMKP